MLAQFWAIKVVNNSGQTVNFDTGAVNLKITGILIDPEDGKIDYSNLADDDLGFDGDENWVDGAELSSSEIDNSGSNYPNALIQLEVTHDAGAAADGTFDIYYEGGDLSGELPSDASGYASAEANKLTHVGSLTWESNGQDNEVMRSNVFVI